VRNILLVACGLAIAGLVALAVADEPAPFSVRRELDIPYAHTDNPRQRLDLYLPEPAREGGPLPVIVFVHGGGWRGGDKKHGEVMLSFVQSGEYAVASIGYRLSDEAIWPAQIHDCKAAIRWLRGHAEKYNLDPDRIGAVGLSAGGHLVAMLGTTGDTNQLDGDLGEDRAQSSKVTCVINQVGPGNLANVPEDNEPAQAVLAWLLGGPVKEKLEEAKNASPVSHASKEDAPCLCVHGTADPLVPYSQAVELTEALRAAGAECVLLTVNGGGHGWRTTPGVDERVRQFLDKHLLGRGRPLEDESVEVGAAASQER
jgi:acetyl esterase/lipase